MYTSFTVTQEDWFLLMDHTVQDWFHPAGWPPAATHQYNTSVSPPWVCLWFRVVQKCGCLCFVQNMGFPTLRTSNMCVNHALLVWWSSVKGCLADFDVTHTEHAYGQHPYYLINKWSKKLSVPSLVDHYVRSLQMWACGLMTWVIQQVSNHYSDGARGSRSS